MTTKMKATRRPIAEKPDVSAETKCKIHAVRDFLWVKPIEIRKVGSIIIPEANIDEANPRDAIVVAAGDGLVEGGNIIPLVVKKGDHVYFPPNSGTLVEIRETDEQFFVLRENQIMGIVTFD